MSICLFVSNCGKVILQILSVLFGTMEQIYFTANSHEGYVRIVKIYGESLWWCDFSNTKITGVSLPQIFKSFQIANSLLDFLISRG